MPEVMKAAAIRTSNQRHASTSPKSAA